MHPLGLYLAITDVQREHGWSAAGERGSRHGVDATPVAEVRPSSRIARLAAMLRRRVVRPARLSPPRGA